MCAGVNVDSSCDVLRETHILMRAKSFIQSLRTFSSDVAFTLLSQYVRLHK